MNHDNDKSAAPPPNRDADEAALLMSGTSPEAEPAEQLVNVAPPPPPSLKKAAFQVALWNGIGFAVWQVTRFVSNIILASLLFREAFGLMATAMVFMLGLHLFADVGLRTSVIQNERGDDPDFYNTAWTMQVIRGFILFFCACLLAWPVAYIRVPPQPELLWLLPIIGIVSIIEGFNSTSIFTLARRMQQGRMVLVELTAQFISLAVTIMGAWLAPSVWPLAVGPLVSAGIIMVWSYRLIPGYRNYFRWDRSAVHELLHFGKWVYVSTALTFLAGQTDRLIVGYRDMGLLGVYHFAAQLAQVPSQLMLTLCNQLVFPLYSRLKQQGRDLKEFFGRVHLVTAGLAALLLAGVMATGETVVQLIYDMRYQDAGWMVRILAIGIWFQIMEAVESSLLWTLGLSRSAALSNLCKVLTLAAGVPLVLLFAQTPARSFLGLIVVFVAGDAVRYLMTLYFVRSQGMPVLRYDLGLLAFIAVAAWTGYQAGQWLYPPRLRPEYVGVLAGSPDAGFLPWPALRLIFIKDYSYLLLRFIVQGTVVVAVWGAAMGGCWRLGLFRKPQA